MKIIQKICFSLFQKKFKTRTRNLFTESLKSITSKKLKDIQIKKKFVYPSSKAQYSETKITTLANGIRVASENSGHPSATVGIWIDSGSRNETKQNNGVAHFLEHMSFKGTTTRSQQDIELEFENMGAVFNAYTSREMTVYYACVDRNNIEMALVVIADILQRSTFPEHLLERERYVIKREMEEVQTIPEEVLFDHLHSIAFQGSPLEQTILGPIENIMKISKNDIEEYIKKNYSCDRIVICGAGGIDHEKLVEITEKHFNYFPKLSSQTKIEKSFFSPAQEIRIPDSEMPLGHVGIAFEGYSWSHPNFFALQVASQLIGSWNRHTGGNTNNSTRLAHKIASHDLAHNFMSYTTCYADTGLWGACFTAEKEKLPDTLYAFKEEWKRLTRDVSGEDVERAKRVLKTMLVSSMESTTQICEEIGRHMLTLNRRMSLLESIARIESIDLDQVREVLEETTSKPPSLAAIGQIESIPSYSEIFSV